MYEIVFYMFGDKFGESATSSTGETALSCSVILPFGYSHDLVLGSLFARMFNGCDPETKQA